MRWQGVATGFLALTLLEVVVSSPSASGQVGGIASGAGRLAQKILDPFEPALGAKAAASSSSSSPGPSSAALTSAPLPGPAPNSINPGTLSRLSSQS